MPIVNRIADLHGDITAWRHDFHAHPELLYDVHRTAASVAEKLKSQTLDPMFMSPEQFARRLKSDYDKYEKVIKLTGAKID